MQSKIVLMSVFCLCQASFMSRAYGGLQDCGEVSAPLCDGSCPDGFTCQANVVAGDPTEGCSCVPVPTGACCVSIGCLNGVGVQACNSGGGIYQGDHTVCDPNSCAGLPSCGSSDPVCNGTCPPGQRCIGRSVAGGGGCICQPITTEACCLLDATCADLTIALCQAANGLPIGTGTTCANNICPTVPSCGDASAPACFGLCPAGSDCVQPAVAGTGECFCRIRTGACCLPSGACTEGREALCTIADGIYQGDNSRCASTSCQAPPDCERASPPNCDGVCTAGGTCRRFVDILGGANCGCFAGPPTGACCLDDGSCGDGVLELACTANGGVYQGDDSDCQGAICPSIFCGDAFAPSCSGFCPTGEVCRSNLVAGNGDHECECEIAFGACCLSGGDCGQSTAHECQVAGGVFQGDDTTCGIVLCPIPCQLVQPEVCLGTCPGDGVCELDPATGNSCDCVGRGACCIPGAGQPCTQLFTERECVIAGGVYQGDETFCPPDNSCPGREPRVSSTKKGSLLIYSKIEVKWNAAGELVQDTFLDITNDYPDGVTVQAYFINGDTEIEELRDSSGGVLQSFEPGWNTADCRFELTANQPHYWSAARGSDKCQPFTVLDDEGPGRLDPEASDGSRILRGYAVFYAVRLRVFLPGGSAWWGIHWNHLKGDALLVNYAESTAWEYNAWAFQARSSSHGGLVGNAFEDLELNGIDYDAAYASLLLDFFASGSTALSGDGESVMVDTDLTLHAVSADFRQDGCGPVLTKVEADIWNEFETKFSGTRRCICCWDQTMLSDWVRSTIVPNHFLREALRTDKGKARLDGVGSTECDYEELCGTTAKMKRWNNCADTLFDPIVAGFAGNGAFFEGSEDAAILGLATKFLAFSPSGKQDTAGMNLVGAGTEPAYIQLDPMLGPEESQNKHTTNRRNIHGPK